MPADSGRCSRAQAVRQALAQRPALRLQEAEIDRREGVRDQAAGDTTAYSAGTRRRLRNGVVLGPVADVAVSDRASPDAPAFGRSRVSFEILVPSLRGLGEESAGANEAAARGDGEVARTFPAPAPWEIAAPGPATR